MHTLLRDWCCEGFKNQSPRQKKLAVERLRSVDHPISRLFPPRSSIQVIGPRAHKNAIPPETVIPTDPGILEFVTTAEGYLRPGAPGRLGNLSRQIENSIF